MDAFAGMTNLLEVSVRKKPLLIAFGIDGFSALGAISRRTSAAAFLWLSLARC
jgi:hypothetical protein